MGKNGTAHRLFSVVPNAFVSCMAPLVDVDI